MKLFKFFFEFYLSSSLHVSFSVWALYKVSFIYSNSTENLYLDGLIITSSIVGYNLIKYGSIYLKNNLSISKSITFITFLSFLVGVWCFFNIHLLTQFIFIISFILVILYVIPNPSSNKNLRNSYGVKIFLVAFAWTLVSHFSLSVHMNITEFDQNIIIAIQRFIFVLVATIPFEIRDSKTDESGLGTLPQRFGIFKSKLFGLSLLIINTYLLYYILEINMIFKIIESFIYLILSYGLLVSSSNKTLNFTRFWIEGIPIFWIFILLLLNRLF